MRERRRERGENKGERGGTDRQTEGAKHREGDTQAYIDRQKDQ